MSVLDNLPPWMGSMPAWATLIIVLGYIAIQWLKNRPVLQQQQIDERLKIKGGYTDRIRDLEQAVKDCQAECEDHKRVLEEKCDLLQTRLNNEAQQRVQSEISLVNTLIQVVDAPQLKTILAALEARQTRMNIRILEDRESSNGRDSEEA